MGKLSEEFKESFENEKEKKNIPDEVCKKFEETYLKISEIKADSGTVEYNTVTGGLMYHMQYKNGIELVVEPLSEKENVNFVVLHESKVVEIGDIEIKQLSKIMLNVWNGLEKMNF